MANILDLQAMEIPQEDMLSADSGQSNHCDDTSTISVFC
ncbi:class III lanthipeptide [Streptomyces sp. NPDC001339]